MIGGASMFLTWPGSGQWLSDIFAFFSPFGTDSRLHWTGLSAFFVLGFAVFVWERHKRKNANGNILGFLFPKSLYASPSTWVDVKVYFANRLLKPVIAFLTIPVSAMIMAMVAAGVQDMAGTGDLAQTGAVAVILASLLVVLLSDFAYYVTHRWSHESDILWPFHKLHHTAEVLTPITAKRNHPVFDLLLRLVTIAIVAPVSGIIFGLFGVFEFSTIFGLNLLIALMNFTGGALRHSHIWLDFGPVLDRIFISPAQHQIHHSCAVRHHDKNYGLTLAVWDWMFGTLYVPEGLEILEFGVADRMGMRKSQVHNTLKEAYLVPFKECADVLNAEKSVPVKEQA